MPLPPFWVNPGESTKSFIQKNLKALVLHGRNDVRIDTVPEFKIKDTIEVILKITSTAICGSDLHIVDGKVPT